MADLATANIPPQTKKPAEVLIVGLGAVGIIYGYLLEQHHQARVTAIARSTYRGIIDNGITIRSKKWGTIENWRPSRVVQSPDELLDSAFDYVVVCTKAVPDVVTTPRLLGPLVTDQYRQPQPVYVLLQNGLGVEKDLAQATSNLRRRPVIISCALYIMTNIQANGEVSHGTFERVRAGIYKETNIPNTPEEQQALDGFVNMLTESNSDAVEIPNVAAGKYVKNLWNASFGMLSALTRLTPLQWLQDDSSFKYAEETISEMMNELLQVGRALGYGESNYLPDPRVFIESAFNQFREGTDFVPSTLLDVRLGKPIEVEAILGEVVRAAKTNQIPTPTLTSIYRTLFIVQADLLARNKRA
ncbi:hypothetical protein FRC16_007372 [Serendipita sp. 398]|nr:hypothetical protein FRC16_007372 [Serendipita sp. 398]